jgi:molybdopterin converting factor small subunit
MRGKMELQTTGERGTLPVRVKFYGVIRDVVDGPQVELELSRDSTVRDLLRSLADRYGEGFVERVMDSQRGIKTYVRLFINDNEIGNDSLDTRLATGEAPLQALVYVLPATTGGKVG